MCSHKVTSTHGIVGNACVLTVSITHGIVGMGSHEARSTHGM